MVTRELLPEAHILRLGHRPSRDKRVSTHLLLAARAFGAKKAFYTGTKDLSLEESLLKITTDWGGKFNVIYIDGWRNVVRDWDGKIVHLTMYGMPLPSIIGEIRSDLSPKLVIVGGAKVPGELYAQVDWNVAVTSQPHSEVSALAIFLNELYQGEMLTHEFLGARLRVMAQPHGKKIQKATSNV